MEDRGRQDRVGTALGDGRDHVRRRARATRGDDRHADARRHGAEQREVEAALCAVPVDRGQEDLAGAELDRSLDPGERHRGPSARRPPCTTTSQVPGGVRARANVHADDDALAAEAPGAASR